MARAMPATGMGKPRKWSVKSDILKRARRYAPAPIKTMDVSQIRLDEGCPAWIWLIRTMGATPNVIMSAKESSCLPMWLTAFSFRATSPSKKSIKPPSKMKRAALWKLPAWIISEIDHIPRIRFAMVIKFGMCFTILPNAITLSSDFVSTDKSQP